MASGSNDARELLHFTSKNIPKVVAPISASSVNTYSDDWSDDNSTTRNNQSSKLQTNIKAEGQMEYQTGVSYAQEYIENENLKIQKVI